MRKLEIIQSPTMLQVFQSSRPASAPVSPEMSSTCRILLAEDNPTNQKVALLQLKKIGFTADTASNGNEVLALCKKQEYDIILMDCQMPEMDGYEATRILRQWAYDSPPQLKRNPRIIALTANALKGDRDKCIAAGMDDYLSKPVTLNELREVLLRNWPAAAPKSTAAIKPQAVQLIDLDRFNSVSRDASGALDPDAFEIFRTAMTELPVRWEQLARKSGVELMRDAHQLKGMVAVFGFSAVAESLAKLEEQASALSPEEITKRVDVIRNQCADTLVELSRQVPELAG
jgi:CheY-like chemotaxis protein